MSDDEDVFICDDCCEIFLSQPALDSHTREKHGPGGGSAPVPATTEEPVKRKMGPASKVKRARSPSLEGEKEKPRKKVKMGPASKVQRSRSSSPEPGGKSPMFGGSSRSVSPATRGPDSKGTIDKIVDTLASTESDEEKKKNSSSGASEKNEEKSKSRDADHHGIHKMKKHKKEKDREKNKPDNPFFNDDHKKLKKEKDHRRDLEKEKGYKDLKHKKDRNKERDHLKEKSIKKSGHYSSDDDEELNRLKAERAKAEWQYKQDKSKGRDGKLSNSRTGSLDSDGFVVSDDEDYKKSKKKGFSLSGLLNGKSEREREREKNPCRPMEEKKEKKTGTHGGGFLKEGTVQAHENDSGPECFKCGQICKDNSNLKNHVLSHYYQTFYDVLPDSKPFPCPICNNTSRDKITMVRHYAFTHKKLFELTDVTPEHLAGFGTRASTGPRPASSKPRSSKDKEESMKRLKALGDDDSSDDGGGKFVNSNLEKSKVEKTRFGDSKEHKKHKKHKHKEHKDHKHKKDKKHKKDRDRDKERRESKDANPLSSLLKEMTPDSASSTPRPRPQEEDGFTDPQAPAKRVAHRPVSPQNEASANGSNGDAPSEKEEQDEEESEDELGDLPAPVFA